MLPLPSIFRVANNVCKDAGYSKVKMGLTSAGNRRADLEVLNIREASRRICWWTSPCATISLAPVAMGG